MKDNRDAMAFKVRSKGKGSVQLMSNDASKCSQWADSANARVRFSHKCTNSRKADQV